MWYIIGGFIVLSLIVFLIELKNAPVIEEEPSDWVINEIKEYSKKVKFEKEVDEIVDEILKDKK